jgi:hypothetical protein
MIEVSFTENVLQDNLNHHREAYNVHWRFKFYVVWMVTEYRKLKVPAQPNVAEVKDFSLIQRNIVHVI